MKELGIDEQDEILIKEFNKGNLGAFENLVTRYQKKIFSFVYRMVVVQEDARDLTQEVFIQVFRSLASFRGEAKFSTWLYRIAANRSLDFLRRKKKLQLVDFAGIEQCEAPDHIVSSNPEDIYLREEKIRRLRRMIAGLPDKYRLVFVMFHYEHLSYQQIAESLELPVKTVATRLYRAKILLREVLGGETDGMS